MAGGRPPGGSRHVMELEGPVDEKHRLRVILDTMAGMMSVKQACVVLCISEARFHQLRSRVLQGALDSLAPKPSGRPRLARVEGADTVAELKEQVSQLEVELQAALVRTELALAMPQVLMDRGGPRGKKNFRRPPS